MSAHEYMRSVVSRRPVPFLQDGFKPKHAEQYLKAYMVETLECGHELTVFPQIDPLTAKRRYCSKCRLAAEMRAA